MRQVHLGQSAGRALEARAEWAETALREIENASAEPTPVPLGGTASDNGRDGLGNLGGWAILTRGTTQLSHTGNTDETTLATITVPAAALGPNGFLRLTILPTYTSDADDKTYRVKFGGTTIATILRTSDAPAPITVLLANRNSASAQVAGGGSASVTATIATTADVTLLITGQLEDGTDAIRVEAYLVEIAYGA